MRKLSADYVCPVTSAAIAHGVVVLNEEGTILAIDDPSVHDPTSIEFFPGVMVPGFINTHCHLELSHMIGKVDTGTGLIPFLQQVVAFRDFPMETILGAIEQADQAMYEAGIVAVGDISNKADTVPTKEKSAIQYYTFVEMFDFLQDHQTSSFFDDFYKAYVEQAAGGHNRKSVAPHAPYTVSPTLFERINTLNGTGVTVSIHNQETIHENDLFYSKTGAFLDFYKHFGFSLDHFESIGQSSIHYAMAHLNPQNRHLFVHNTMTNEADIRAAQEWCDEVYWATCPNANLYIENRMPNYQFFLNANAKVTIGTDSLTSNWQLSILEEMKTIARYQSYIDFQTLLKWATINGAEALGFANRLGSLEVGKTPGINLLAMDWEQGLQQDTTVRKLA